MTSKQDLPPPTYVVAKALSDRHARQCGVDADDLWKTYSDDFYSDASFILEAIRVHEAAKKDSIAQGMSAVADEYAHRLAMELECVLAGYNGIWYDSALKTLSGYRDAMNKLHEQESPTFMGEPVLAAAPAPEAEQAEATSTVIHQHGFAADNNRLRVINESLDKQLEEVMAERDERDDVLGRIAGIIDAEFTSAYGFADLERDLEERLHATQPTASNAGEREAMLSAADALKELIAAGQAAKTTLDTSIPIGEPVHRVSASLTWPLSTAILAEEKLRAALASKPPAGEQKPVGHFMETSPGHFEQAGAEHAADPDVFPLYRAPQPARSFDRAALDHALVLAGLMSGAHPSGYRSRLEAHLAKFVGPQPEQVEQDKTDAERWRAFIGLEYKVRAEWANNLSLAPVLTEWVDQLAARARGEGGAKG